MDKIKFIAAVWHACWVSYQIAVGQPYNEKINDDQLESIIDGVKFALANPGITPEENHNNWMKMKIEQGWVYGPVKDLTLKTHPDLVNFKLLPAVEQQKDIMDGIARSMAVDIWNELYK